MKRHPALHSLSSDHHQALVLALRIGKAVARPEEKAEEVAALLASVPPFFHTHLEPHFQTEERDLFPALAAAGQAALVARTAAEHAEMRGLLRRIEAGDSQALAAFGVLLKAHVQFEEKELFVAYEGTLPKS